MRIFTALHHRTQTARNMQPITALVFTGGMLFSSLSLDKPTKNDLFNKADMVTRHKKTCPGRKRKNTPGAGCGQPDLKSCLKAVYYSDVRPYTDLDK